MSSITECCLVGNLLARSRQTILPLSDPFFGLIHRLVIGNCHLEHIHEALGASAYPIVCAFLDVKLAPMLYLIRIVEPPVDQLRQMPMVFRLEEAVRAESELRWRTEVGFGDYGNTTAGKRLDDAYSLDIDKRSVDIEGARTLKRYEAILR